jgi:hypothetical protein
MYKTRLPEGKKCYDLLAVYASEYQPHHLTRKTEHGDRKVKETMLSIRNIQDITTLASDTPTIDIRAQLLEEVWLYLLNLGYLIKTHPREKSLIKSHKLGSRNGQIQFTASD